MRSRLEGKSASAAAIAGVNGEATNPLSTPGTVGSLEVARLAHRDAAAGSAASAAAASK